MGGFAIHPAPGRRPSDSLPPSAAGTGTTTTTTTTSSSASSSFSLDDAVRRGVHHHHHQTRLTSGHTLEEPPSRRRNRAGGRHGNGASSSSSSRLLQRLRHALPVLTLTPRCGKMQQVGTPAEIAAAASSSSSSSCSSCSSSAAPAPKGVSFSRPCRRVTGTLYGHRRGRVVLALQETPRCLPTLVVELALQTHALLRELGNPAGARIVLETERRAVSLSDPDAAAARAKRGGGRGRAPPTPPPLLDEPSWTMFCNGKKTGYAVRREATDDDLTVMETLRVVSMGAGVLPGTRATSLVIDAAAVAADDEVPYMRGCFDHFIGSRDSESLYMVAPQGGGTGPELAVFFVRL